jgi:UDP-N-acetylmuramoyl-tripeptide--D-alanyl-D-alanine ligase
MPYVLLFPLTGHARSSTSNECAGAPCGVAGTALRCKLELGLAGADLHRGLNEAVKANGIDAAFCGLMMRNVWDALSSGKRGGYAGSAAELESQVAAGLRTGDVIMVKGSLGSRMKTIVNALEKRFPDQAAPDDAAT